MAEQKYPSGHRPAIPPAQLNLPIAFLPDGRTVTLQEVQDTNPPIVPWSELNMSQRADLTARRIDMETDFDMLMMSIGYVDKHRAIKEVREMTLEGKTLIEIEGNMIAILLEELQLGSP